LGEFDSYYLQLFVWHELKREIAGAYRLRQTDVILRDLGQRGRYTRKRLAPGASFSGGLALPSS
jgi:hypothetical protein